jgi:DNA-directed RNA polymerase subunit L
MRKRLEQITVPNINVPILFLDDKYWRDVDYGNLEREKDPNDIIVLDLVINQKNGTADVFNLTTNDIRLFQDGVDVSEKFDKNYPILLLKLRKGETFKCTAKAVLGKGLRNNIWAAAATAYHEYDDKHTIKFTIESQGQLDEYDILYRCCRIMKNKVSQIKEKLKEKFSVSDITKQTYLLINFDKEDHTFGEVLNEFLQENNDVAFSGISKPDLLKNEITIKMKSVKNNPLIPLFDTMDYVINVYDSIEKSIMALGKKYILAK